MRQEIARSGISKGYRMEEKTKKREIRTKILRQRESLSAEARKKGDILLTERILGHQWFYRSEYFLCNVNYGSEISTRDILTEALKAGKKVYVPKVLADKEPEMAFFRIDALEDLITGYKGIPEPAGDTEIYSYTPDRAEQSLMLMPGVAFDKTHHRVGYGGGFYDRYLEKPNTHYKVALAFDFQVLEAVPYEPHDILIDLLVTESTSY